MTLRGAVALERSMAPCVDTRHPCRRPVSFGGCKTEESLSVASEGHRWALARAVLYISAFGFPESMSA